jgi:GNAT superfamily N-acetyltransferase
VGRRSSGRPGWLEIRPGSQFAGLWGGATLAEWRGRGIYRALVARRAQLAAARGVRYLQVDASSDSSPILQRLGFQPLANHHPLRLDPALRTRTGPVRVQANDC